MEFLGNVTANAVVRTTKDGEKFVSFSVARNKKYYSKGEAKERTTFIECAYWLNVGIAPYLTTGMKVYISGDMLPARAYIKDGIAYASNQFFVEKIELLSSKKNRIERVADALAASAITTTGAAEADDLPF